MKEFFPITSVSREDVAGVLSKRNANTLTDREMRRIASKMADDYLNQLYWSSLRIIAEYVLKERKGEVRRYVD